MDISALSKIGAAAQTGLTGAGQASSGVDGTSMFKDIYDGLIDGVNQTDSALQGDILKAAAGELDDPQQLLIDSSKATISLQLLSSVRNNALTAYEDIIKMQV